MENVQLRCLVTGGAGFIGRHLVDCPLSDGHEVTVLDNFCTGRKQNLAQHKGNPKLTILEKDIADFLSIKDYFAGIEWVFHLAARADIVHSIVSPIECHRSNVDGTVAVLEASRRAGVKRFLYTASSS